MGRRAPGGLHANAEPGEQLCAPAAGAEAESSGERLAAKVCSARCSEASSGWCGCGDEEEGLSVTMASNGVAS